MLKLKILKFKGTRETKYKPQTCHNDARPSKAESSLSNLRFNYPRSLKKCLVSHNFILVSTR